MKKINNISVFLALLVSLIISNSSNAQSNLGFESWVKKGTYYDIIDWSTANAFVVLGGNVSCTREAPHGGSYALGISSVKVPSIDTLPGFAVQTFPYSQRPKSVRIYYKYKSHLDDTSTLFAFFYKGTIRDTNNIIGRVRLNFVPNSNWTYASSDIVWKNNQTPDTTSLVIQNSRRNFKDTLIVDDLEISLASTKIESDFISDKYYNFINTKGEFYIDEKIRSTGCEIVIVNSVGQTIYKNGICELPISLGDIPKGIYFYSIQNNFGIKSVGKFWKE